MTEGPPIDLGEQRELGEVFKPFAGVTELPPIAIDPEDVEQPLLESSITVRGISGKIGLIAAVGESLFLGSIVTPYGTAREVIEHDKGKRTVVEAPLVLNSDFTLTSLGQMPLFQRLVLEVVNGEGIPGLELRGSESPEIIRDYLRRGEDINVGNNQNAEEGSSIIIPYNPQIVANMEVRIVERDLNEE